MKKILWLSNCLFSDVDIKTSGTWIFAMANNLLKTQYCEIYNITQSNIDEVRKEEIRGLTQWVIPIQQIDKNGLPPKNTIELIRNIHKEVEPDLVHIWGTESFWGMLYIESIKHKKLLLEIQGVLSSIIDVYYGGLSGKEIKQCRGLKELVFRRTYLKNRYNKLIASANFENKIISTFNHISVQSQWVKAQIQRINKEAELYYTKIILRDAFSKNKWAYRGQEHPVLFTSSSTAVPYKGLHILFYALSNLKKKYPTIRLKIAGGVNPNKHKLLKDGYTNWLIRLVGKLRIQESVTWLGPLDEGQIVNHMLSSDINVVPSFVESYSLAAAESLALGLPTVVSDSGALPELGVHNKSLLIFKTSSAESCATQIERLLSSKILSETLSQNSKIEAINKNKIDIAVKTQIDIYDKIIG